uniref:Uncharacterized protein n=1 Tax=Lepeophtheirus salmonis TaxID=72036 RepID=A0A0K2TAR9_LEPSM
MMKQAIMLKMRPSKELIFQNSKRMVSLKPPWKYIFMEPPHIF